jgi:hypothetical protein
LGDSLAAISYNREAAEGDITYVPDILRWSLVLSTVLLEADFSIQMVNSANKESSAEDFL